MKNRMVSIVGLDKAAVLAVLYNRALTGGMGFMQYDPRPMTVEQAREILRSFEGAAKKFFFRKIEKQSSVIRIYFDYIAGRAMKVDLTSDKEFDASTYDEPCYNGDGAAEDAIRSLRETGDVNSSTIQAAQLVGFLAAVKRTRKQLHEETEPTRDVEIPGLGLTRVVNLGLNDVADVLGSKIDEAEKRVRGDK